MVPSVSQPRDIQQMRSAEGKRRKGVIPIPRVAAELGGWCHAEMLYYMFSVLHASGFLEVV